MALTPTTEEIYYASDWAERRETEREWQEWYSGDELREQTTGAQDENGEKQKRYPLAINSAKVYCEIHRDIMFGMPKSYDEPPVRMAFISKDDTAETLQTIFDRITDDSHLATLQVEAGLMMQIRGGHAFQVVWEPWNPFARYGIRIVARESSTVYPIYDQADMWHLQECYIGYQINAEEARQRYFVKAEGVGGEVIYLEHWTRDTYQIRIGNEIAKRKIGDELVPLEGPHDFGRVPVIYIPHHRSDDFYGYSHVADLIGLMKEENDRLTDSGDAVQAATHPILIGRNISEAIKFTPLYDAKKRIIGFFHNLGVKKNFTNSGEPELAYVVPPAVGDAATQLNEDLRKKMNFVTRVTGAAIGEQDMSSGRVSGTVMGANQWSTIAHTTMGERYPFTVGMREITKAVLDLLFIKQGIIRATIEPDLPVITKQMLDTKRIALWYPAIPIDAITQADILIRRLEAEGIDLVTFLREMGEVDPEAAAEEILKYAKEFAKIEALKRPQPQLNPQKEMSKNGNAN